MALVSAGGLWLWGLGCVGEIQRELSVLLASEAEPLLVRSSFLAEMLGTNVIRAILG